MFKVLHNPEATCKQLANAHKQAVEAEQGLKTEQERAYTALLDIQKNHLADSKESKQVKDALAAYEIYKIKHESCLYGMEQLKTKMVERLPVEAKQRIEQIEAETEILLSRKKELHEKYLLAVAETELILNKIEGRPLMYNKSAAEYVPGALRGVDFAIMSPDDVLFIKQAMAAKDNADEPAVNLSLSKLWDESEKLENLLSEPDLADQNPPTIAEKLEREVERLIETA